MVWSIAQVGVKVERGYNCEQVSQHYSTIQWGPLLSPVVDGCYTFVCGNKKVGGYSSGQ